MFEALQPVLEAQVESPEVRQAVAMVLLSWRPDEAWWLRLARASWKEESKAMAEFIFTASKTISQLRSPAWQQQCVVFMMSLFWTDGHSKSYRSH